MNVLLFGATGMVGQGVLRECLLAPDVTQVVTLGRSPTGQTHARLREIVARDLYDLTPHASELAGFDACFFCLGVSSVGMSEADYARVTYDLTLAVARTLVERNPGMTFVYVSGLGTDSTEKGRTMWARVKGRTENALLAMPFAAAYMFRPGFIVPLHGVRSKTRLYQAGITLLRPVTPLLRGRFPKYVTTSEQVGRAMLEVVRRGYPKGILESEDINSL